MWCMQCYCIQEAFAKHVHIFALLPMSKAKPAILHAVMLYICYFSNALKYISTSTISLGRNPLPDGKNIPPIQKKLLLNYGCDASSQFPLVHQIIGQDTQPTCMASDYQIIILLKLHQSQSMFVGE